MNTQDCTPITSCLACGSTDLVLTLNLNDQPLANNFRDSISTDNELRYPLAINRCQHCNHLQLTHSVDPAIIYTNYLYVSGTSDTYVKYMDWYADFVLEYFDGIPGTVLDIGCNDGSQLDAFKRKLVATYGVDPAENLHPVSSGKGHNVVCGFWNKETADQLQPKFDIITSQNAFAHVPDPVAYLKLAKEHLDDYGLIFISTSQADMVLNGEFDTIYHEHISYYNAASMKALAERAGLHLIDVVKTPIHGTSYIFVLAKHNSCPARVANIITMEAVAGLDKGNTYTKWGFGVNELLTDIRRTVIKYRLQGMPVVGYGAAAKGMTLINASGIKLDAVIDDNPLKQGKYCPGTDIPVVSSEYLKQFRGDDRILFIPLAWNFYEEIKRKIRDIRVGSSDVYMTYFPTIKTEE